MVVNMLKAISQMLAVDGATATPAAYERVKCAKIMLDEIIKGMEEPKAPLEQWPQLGGLGKIPGTGNPPPTFAPSTSAKPHPLASELEPKEPEYKLEINPDKTLKSMTRDGRPLEKGQLLMIDGKQVTYEKAVGKPFTNLKVVE